MAGCFKCFKRNQTKEIKLVIIGLDNAGKTTTLACLQGEPPDGIAPTVGFANANLTMGKWNIVVYDLGGGESVRSVWQKYYAEVYGMIFAVDSSDVDRLIECRNVLNEIFKDPRVKGKPLVVFANKQDRENALDEKDISKKLDLPGLSEKHSFNFNIFSCSAIKGYGKSTDKRIKTGLNWLLNSINQDFSLINEKVTKESTIQQEEERKERKERLERIKKIREERERAAKEAGIIDDESDDEMANPFKNIDDQVAITEKREKKAKEKKKKIKEHQMKTNNVLNSDVSSKLENETYDNIQSSGSRNLPNIRNKSIENLKYDNNCIESPRHCIIQVSSKEDLRDNSPPPVNKKKKSEDESDEEDVTNSAGKSRKLKKNLNHANNYYVNESEIKSEKEINDSRAELFLARSSESLDLNEHVESDCCNSKKNKLNSDFHNVQNGKIESKKKKRKKINRTEPKETSIHLKNSSSGGALPPIRGASKLPPLELDTQQ